MLNIEPDEFLILGHRGASAYARDNTLDSFELAKEQRADGVELDVRRTADNELVVHHDVALENGAPIVSLTLEEVKSAAPHVPTLAQAMGVLRDLVVNIEIKNWDAEADFDPEHRVAIGTAEWLEANSLESQVLISSFNPQTIDVVKEGWPGLATAQLLGSGIDLIQAASAIAARRHQGMNPRYESVGDVNELAATARKHGLWMIPWTVDDPDAIRELAGSGATGVFTNDPAMARGALQS